MDNAELDIVWKIFEAIVAALVLWGVATIRRMINVVDKLSFVILGIDGTNGMRSKLRTIEERTESLVHRADQHDNTLARVFERIEALEEEES